MAAGHCRQIRTMTTSYCCATSMASSKMISFAELIQGPRWDLSVRITDNSLLYAVDLTMVVHGSN
jgi:hypothetical protein